MSQTPEAIEMLRKSEIDARLRAIEAEMPRLRRDMNTFYRAFEDRVDQLCCEVDPSDQDYVLDELNALVDRAGINA